MRKKQCANSPTSISPNHHSLTRHTAMYLTGRVVTALVNLGILVAFTRVLSPTEYGRFAVITAIGALIVGVGFEWPRQGLVRFGTNVLEDRPKLLGTLGALYGALVGGTILVAIFVLLVGGIFNLRITHFYLGVLCSVIFAQAWFELAGDAARVEFKPWRYGAATFARAVLCLVLGTATAFLTHSALTVVFASALAWLVGSFVAAPRWILGLFSIRRATWAEIRRLASYGLPLAVTLGMVFVLDSADRLMLASMRGYTEAGIYASAYIIAQSSIGTVLGGLNLGSLPLAIRMFNSANPQDAKRLLERNLLFGLGLGLPAVVGLLMIVSRLDRLLLGNFVPGKSDAVTMIVSVGAGFAGIRAFCFDTIFMLYQRTLIQGCMLSVAAALNVGLNVLLIPQWGVIGAAWATLFSFTFALLASWLLGRRYMKLSLPLGDVIKIVIGSGLVGLVAFLLLGRSTGWLDLMLTVIGSSLVYFIAVIIMDVANSRRRVRLFWQSCVGRL